MIRLTYDEWRTVKEQCSACKHWGFYRQGCQFPGAPHNDYSPVQDCGNFERKAEEAEG